MAVESKLTAIGCRRADYNNMSILSVDIMRTKKGRWRNMVKIPDDLPVSDLVEALRDFADSVERNCT